MSASGCWRRGAKVLDSGFSFAAVGQVHCFEDHPAKLHISNHTKDLMKGDPVWPREHNGNIRVGSANWTHTNSFCRAVQHECAAPADHTSYAVPVKDGRIDKTSILGDPRQSQLAKYLKEGMVCSVFPYWVAEAYPLVPQIFQSAANQVMQVQEGDIPFLSTHSLYIAVLSIFSVYVHIYQKGVSSTLSYYLYIGRQQTSAPYTAHVLKHSI